MSRSLYEQDFVRWTEEQTKAIRDAGNAGTNLPIDWENVAEEIDSSGRSQRTELRSRIATIVELLLKLEASPADDPRRSWEDTVRAQRRDVRGLLEDSPSLRREVAGILERVLPEVRDDIRQSLVQWGERPRIDLDSVEYTESQVMGPWLPEHPPSLSRAARRRRRARNT